MRFRHYGPPELLDRPARTRDARDGEVASMSLGRVKDTARQTYGGTFTAQPGGVGAELPHERRYDEGNRRYLLSLPPGEYEAEDDEAAGLTRIHAAGRHSGTDEASLPHDERAEFIVALPLGRYSIDRDERGFAHVYREPEDDNTRVPLTSDRFPASILRLFRVS